MENLTFAQIQPSEASAPHVEFFWILHNPNREPISNRHLVFPDGGMDLVVRQEPQKETQTTTAYFSGVTSASRREILKPLTTVAGMRLRPGSAFGLFRLFGTDLRDQVIPLAEVGSKEGGGYLESFTRAHSPVESLRLLERWLLTQLRGLAPIEPIVLHAVKAMEESHGGVRVGELETAGFGSRQLRRKFDKYIGLSPKQYCRVLRLSHALDLARCSSEPDWADLALSAGYYDQSHLIHEFLEVSGTTPEKYFASTLPVRFFQYSGLENL